MLVTITDPISGLSREINDPRAVTSHGYRCPVCRGIIDACHAAALSYDPDRTNPAGFALVN